MPSSGEVERVARNVRVRRLRKALQRKREMGKIGGLLRRVVCVVVHRRRHFFGSDCLTGFFF